MNLDKLTGPVLGRRYRPGSMYGPMADSTTVPPAVLQCQHCRFWKHSDRKPPFEKWGYCHRRAPQVGLSDDGDRWPASESTDFCGESGAKS